MSNVTQAARYTWRFFVLLQCLTINLSLDHVPTHPSSFLGKRLAKCFLTSRSNKRNFPQFLRQHVTPHINQHSWLKMFWIFSVIFLYYNYINYILFGNIIWEYDMRICNRMIIIIQIRLKCYLDLSICLIIILGI